MSRIAEQKRIRGFIAIGIAIIVTIAGIVIIANYAHATTAHSHHTSHLHAAANEAHENFS